MIRFMGPGAGFFSTIIPCCFLIYILYMWSLFYRSLSRSGVLSYIYMLHRAKKHIYNEFQEKNIMYLSMKAVPLQKSARAYEKHINTLCVSM